MRDAAGAARPPAGPSATTGRDVTAARVHTGSMRQVIRLPEPKVRPAVEARRKAGADITVDIFTAVWPADLPTAGER